MGHGAFRSINFLWRRSDPARKPNGSKMKRRIQFLVIVGLVAGVAAAAGSPIGGTWQGKMNNLPAVTLSVKDEGDKLSGTITFYRVMDDGSGPAVAGKDTLDLVNPKLEGKTFSFEVKTPNGEMRKMVFQITGENEGSLKVHAIRRDDEGNDDQSSQDLKMVREK